MKYCFRARDTTSIKLLFSLRSTKRGIKKFCSENYDVFQFCHLEQNRQWEILTQNNYWFMNNAYICDYVIMYYYATRNMSCTINEIKMKKHSYFHDSFLYQSNYGLLACNPLPSTATARPPAVSSLRSPNPVYMTAEDPYTVFENHRKSLIQHCERNELRLHFEWTKVN